MWEISIRILVNIQHVRNIYTDPKNRDQWVSVWPEILKKLVGLSNHSFLCICYGPLKKFFDALPKSYYKKLLSKFEGIKTDFEVSFQEIYLFLFRTVTHIYSVLNVQPYLF